MFTVICLIDIFSYGLLSEQGPLHFIYFMTITFFFSDLHIFLLWMHFKWRGYFLSSQKKKFKMFLPFCECKIQVIAVGIGVGVGLHAISHLTCDFPRLLHASEEQYKPMIPYFGVQPTSYWWFVKGVEGVTGVIMVILMAIAFTLATPWFRRNKLNLPKPLKKFTGFNAFWYSHHLFVIVYALLIVHGIKLYLTKTWYQKTVSFISLDLPVTF